MPIKTCRSVEDALARLEEMAHYLSSEEGADRVKRQEQPGAYDGDRGVT